MTFAKMLAKVDVKLVVFKSGVEYSGSEMCCMQCPGSEIRDVILCLDLEMCDNCKKCTTIVQYPRSEMCDTCAVTGVRNV